MHCSAATSGCGSQNAGFRLTIKLRPSTVYDIIVGSQGTVTPQFKVSVTAQDGTLVPWPTPLGSWRNPNQVPSLPFTTAQFSVSAGAAAERPCARIDAHNWATSTTAGRLMRLRQAGMHAA